MLNPLRKWQLVFALGLLVSNGLELWSIHVNNTLFLGWIGWAVVVLTHLVVPAAFVYWLQIRFQTGWLTTLMRVVFWTAIVVLFVGARSPTDLFNPGVIGGVALAWFLLYGSEIHNPTMPAHLGFLRKRGRYF